MVRRYEILRNNIHTILSRISLYAKNYPIFEKEILFKFTSVLMHYQEAEFQREKLITRLDDYIEENTGTNLYLQTPFLWFSREFCTKANLILKEAKYHAEDFYTYIINNLRAIFKLVHSYTSLLDIDAFESLQYKYNRSKVPLSREQLQNVESLFSEITNSGYLALDPLHVKTVYYKNRGRTKIYPDVSTFFKLLDIRIILFFCRHAFDLEHFYINFQLTENTSLKEVVDLQDGANTLLSNSNVLQVRETSNSFIGLLTSPITCHDSLKAYFKKKDRQGKIIIHEMMNLNLTHLHQSLALYRPDKGWRDLNKTQRKVLTRRLLTKNPRKKRKNNLHQFFLSPSSDSTWHFKQHDQPEELIKLFCEVSREFTLENLPLNFSNPQSSFLLTPKYLSLIRDLQRKMVLNVSFRSHRLLNEWSLDTYFVKLPILPDKQLLRMIQWLPFGQLFTSDQNLYLYVRLRPEWVQWIENEMKWTIWPVMGYLYPQRLRYQWFDSENLRWRSPSILTS